MFEHGGIKIEFDEKSAQFSARLDGKIFRTTSLAGIKKKIDTYKEQKAGSFTGIVTDRWTGGIKRVSIIGIARPKANSRWSKSDKWKSDTAEYSVVYKDTPENESAIRAAIEMEEKHKKERDVLLEKHEKLCKAAWDALARHELPK